MQVCALLAAPLAESLKWYGTWTIRQVVTVCALLLHIQSEVKLRRCAPYWLHPLRPWPLFCPVWF